MPVTVQAITEQDQAEEGKKSHKQVKSGFFWGFCLFIYWGCVFLLLLFESREFLGEIK